ncbi:MAG: DUF5721 family protein [Lachnospiraceae bacterium]|nr:DUF5721 family protein [Lachnospiraceae bacterium]
MFALQIDEVKTFMQRLLTDSAFDSFLFVEGSLQMGFGYEFDGHLNRDFFTEEELAALPEEEVYLPYSQVRPILFSLIRGKKTPLSLRLTLQLGNAQTRSLLASVPTASSVKGFLLNIRFDGQKVFLTGGVNYDSFSLDKTPERVWDQWLEEFIKSSCFSPKNVVKSG